jgi:hypothetical protein
MIEPFIEEHKDTILYCPRTGCTIYNIPDFCERYSRKRYECIGCPNSNITPKQVKRLRDNRFNQPVGKSDEYEVKDVL